MKDKTCPNCGGEYVNIGRHWAGGKCSYPEPSQRQEEIIQGSLLGDACIDNSGDGNPYIKWEMISPNYLDYLEHAFGVLSNNVKPTDKHHKDNITKSPTYVFRTVRNPSFKRYSREDRPRITPTVLKHWYCQDGSVTWDRRIGKIVISSTTIPYNDSWLQREFERVGVEPIKYDSVSFKFSKSDSVRLLKYMGRPLPDFWYKWCIHDRDAYYEVEENEVRPDSNGRRRLSDGELDRLTIR